MIDNQLFKQKATTLGQIAMHHTTVKDKKHPQTCLKTMFYNYVF